MPPRTLFYFDPDDGAGSGVATASAEADPSAAVSSGGAEPEAAGGAPSAEAAPAWAGPSQDEWGEVVGALGYLASQIPLEQQTQIAAEQQSAGEPVGLSLDPFADDFGDNLGQLLDQRLEALVGRLEQRLDPLVQSHEREQIGEAEQRALDIIGDIESRDGEFLSGDDARHAVRALAETLVGETRQRFGPGPRAAEAALSRAAQIVRGIEKSVSDKAVEQYRNQLSNVGGARQEPGISGAAVSNPSVDGVSAETLGRRIAGQFRG